jgi:hypothetical protein
LFVEEALFGAVFRSFAVLKNYFRDRVVKSLSYAAQFDLNFEPTAIQILGLARCCD